MPASAKSAKESFVSGLNGGSVAEINYVTAVAPAAFLVWSILQSQHSYFVRPSLPSFIVDFALNIGAILLAITLYANISPTFDAILLALAVLAYSVRSMSNTTNVTTRKAQEKGQLPIRPFITAYRGSMMVVTCLAILAVDFPIFPRRFAKVETWGTSLMDMGVGSFVFSAGLVSARPLLKRSMQLKSAIRSMLPLLVLGFVRLASVKAVDYAEHVTEYGVHWNFFFTLAFLAPFVALMQLRPRWISPVVLPVAIMLVYEAMLHNRRILTYILTASRVDVISQNREGIFSFCGYLAIFLAGQALGLDILPGARRGLWRRLSLWLVVWLAQYMLTTSYNFGLNWQVSRRLANAAYVEWVVAFNVGQIFCFCAIESICFPRLQDPSFATSRIFHAFNRNGLAIFLLANLLTGAVNLSMDTLNMSVGASLAVLMAYATILSGAALVLDVFDISLKL